MEEFYEVTVGQEVRKYRIEADPDGGYVTAFLVNEEDDYEDEVGQFSYELSDIPQKYGEDIQTYELWSMNVEPEHQGIGLGTKMIELGEECFEVVSYPKETGTSEGNHLSSEGSAFLQSCIDKGIIDHNLFGD